MNTWLIGRAMMIVLLCLMAGAGVVAYVSFVGNSTMLVTALPFVLAMVILLIVDKRKLFLLILLFRAAGDQLFDTAKFGFGGINIGVGGLINALIILIAILFVLERPRVVSKTIMSIWAGVFLTTFVALANAPETGVAVRTFLALISYCAVFVIAFYIVRSIEDFHVCIRTVLWSSLLPVTYAFVDVALHGGGIASESFRLKSTFSHANIMAFYLVLVISLALYQLKSMTFKIGAGPRFVLSLYMVVLLALLLLTKTRSAWAACFFVFAVYGALFERRFLLYLLIAPLLALLVPSVRDRILDLGSGNDYVQYAKLNSFAWRLLIWRTGIEWMSLSHIPFGYGLGGFKYFSTEFFPMSGGIRWGAHSVYVQWLFEAGVVGVMCSAWMFYRLFRSLLAGLHDDKLGTAIVMTLVVEYLVFSFSDNMLDYLSFNWYFWFVIGAACAAVLARKAPVTEPVSKPWLSEYSNRNLVGANALGSRGFAK